MVHLLRNTVRGGRALRAHSVTSPMRELRSRKGKGSILRISELGPQESELEENYTAKCRVRRWRETGTLVIRFSCWEQATSDGGQTVPLSTNLSLLLKPI